MIHVLLLVPFFFICTTGFLVSSDRENDADVDENRRPLVIPPSPQPELRSPALRRFSHSTSPRSVQRVSQGDVQAAPVARQEVGLLYGVWSLIQGNFRCYRTVAEADIASNTFCDKNPTSSGRILAITQTLTELAMEAEKARPRDYLRRATVVIKYAELNNITVLPEQKENLLQILQKKEKDLARLRKLLTDDPKKQRGCKPGLSTDKQKKASESSASEDESKKQ